MNEKKSYRNSQSFSPQDLSSKLEKFEEGQSHSNIFKIIQEGGTSIRNRLKQKFSPVIENPREVSQIDINEFLEKKAKKFSHEYAKNHLKDPNKLMLFTTDEADLTSKLSINQNELKASIKRVHEFIDLNQKIERKNLIILLEKKIPIQLTKKSFDHLKKIDVNDIKINKIKFISLYNIDESRSFDDIGISIDKSIIINFKNVEYKSTVASKSQIVETSKSQNLVHQIDINLDDSDTIDSKLIIKIAKEIYANIGRNYDRYTVVIHAKDKTESKFKIEDINLDSIKNTLNDVCDKDKLSINNDLFKLIPTNKNATTLKIFSQPSNASIRESRKARLNQACIYSGDKSQIKRCDDISEKFISYDSGEDERATPSGSLIGITKSFVFNLSEAINERLNIGSFEPEDFKKISSSHIPKEQEMSGIKKEVMGKFTEKLNSEVQSNYLKI